MSNKTLRETIRAAIDRQDLNVMQISRKAELNHQTLYNYLAGRSDVKGETLERLMAVLGLKLVGEK